MDAAQELKDLNRQKKAIFSSFENQGTFPTNLIGHKNVDAKVLY